eukprot:NODE_3766_length_904_cov_115.989704_g3613_i0.p1 GENE.NODE_3766_length_904_cov_115.989704_g3613_i0~~NODE_3766_length_904_cov_115.989704_g3613_i0.p1  ORF type:complete len:257 (-),score=55.53 NODE_3766_length_904_cov_115.989704_g3613_i0:77-847(-)
MAKTASQKAASALAQANKVPDKKASAPQEGKKDSPVDLTKAPVKPTQKLKKSRGRKNQAFTIENNAKETIEQQNSRIVYVTHLPEQVTAVQLLGFAPEAQNVKVLFSNRKHHLPEQVMAVHFPTAEQACKFAQQGQLKIAEALCPMIVGFSTTEGCWRCMKRGHSDSACKSYYERVAYFSTRHKLKMPLAEHSEVEAEFGKVEDMFYNPGKARAIRSLLFPTKALAEAAIAKQTVTLAGRQVQLKADRKCQSGSLK